MWVVARSIEYRKSIVIKFVRKAEQEVVQEEVKEGAMEEEKKRSGKKKRKKGE